MQANKEQIGEKSCQEKHSSLFSKVSVTKKKKVYDTNARFKTGELTF